MAIVHRPAYAKKTNALREIVKQVKFLKGEYAETNSEEKIERMLVEVRKLWQAAWNCDDAPSLHKVVQTLNDNKWLINREFKLSRNLTHNGYEYQVSVERM